MTNLLDEGGKGSACLSRRELAKTSANFLANFLKTTETQRTQRGETAERSAGRDRSRVVCWSRAPFPQANGLRGSRYSGAPLGQTVPIEPSRLKACDCRELPGAAVRSQSPRRQ